LHPRVIARHQVERLIEKVLAKQRVINERESSSKANRKQQEATIGKIHVPDKRP
jgi:hypothetical protein